MRLARLDLVRYGKFTGRTLDFGSARAGRPDLHVIYGPNEAGKSTAFAAYLDLLFGIRATKEPNYAFLHPYPTMRIGARLDLSGGPRDLVRIRRAQATLLDVEDRPVDEGLLTAELGGIGRDAYRSMFSLDDDSLEQGGDDILASRGDLGQILFSGSAGAAGLSRALDGMREEADRFFRPGAQKTRLNDLRAELDDLKAGRDEADTQAPVYKRLVEERDRAAAAYDAALTARSEAAVRRDEIGRLLAALPRLVRLRGLRDAVAPLLALPDPPDGWSRDLPELDKEEVRLDAEARAVAREADELARELDGLVDDPAALALAEQHEGLSTTRAAAVTAGTDLPRRRLRLAEAEGAVAAAMARLGRPVGDPDAVALPAAVVGTLRALVTEWSGVGARLDDARVEVEAATRELAAARDALAAAGGGDGAGDGAALARVAALLEALSQADPARARRAAERARDKAEGRVAEALRTLAPWTGTAEQLAALALPAERDVAAWAAALAEAEAETARRDGEAADLSVERDALRAQVDALARLAGPLSDAEALALRTGRERAWAAHRARLDAASADDFEDAMRRDDAVAAARFGQAGDVARLKEASLTLAGLETRLGAAVARAGDARRRGAAAEVAASRATASFEPPFREAPTPAGLAAWLARTGPVLRALADARDAADACRDAAEECGAWRDRLHGALAEAGVAPAPGADLDALAAAARTAVDGRATLDALARTLAQAEARVAERAAALGRAEAAAAGWRARWEAACAGCWLGEGGSAPPLAAVGEMLDVLSGLAPELRTRADLLHRIAAMEADEARFAARVTDLAAALAMEGPGAAADPERVLAIDAAIGRRIAGARAAQTARDAGRAKLAAVETRRAGIVESQSANAARADRLRDFFGVATLAEVGARLKLCEERDRLRREVTALEDEIRAGLRRPDIAGAEAQLEGLDAEALEREIDGVAGRYDAADLDLQTHHAARTAAQARVDAVGGDDVVARLETRRRVVLLDIEEQARGFIRLKGGIAAAEQALTTYRDRHRSAMLQEASKAFALISRGGYAGLAAQPSDKGEILIARAADGTTKQAADLSKGTRFQLYLALRAAGYREFAATRRPVPFVADDIMETFDDFRAEEAFRLFGAMAEVGQVIYLTHHRHLVDIARAACPAVTVHDLTPAS